MRRRGTISEGLEVECRVRGAFSLTSICIPRIADRTADSLESAVADGYEAIGDQLRNHSHHAIRLWNFVPDIHAHVRPGIDRYMVFNAGRFCGYERWYGSASEFGVSLAAASAVGTFDDTLRIYCLGAEIPGVALENPRQIPAYRYSARYGPRPPCFARATMVDGLMLTSGTASIRGEDSVHLGDVGSQLLETFENLRALLRAAGGRRGSISPGAETLASFDELRVYVVRESDLTEIAAAVERSFPRSAHVEFVKAELCRPELLVEIEGVARLPDPSVADHWPR